jgi:two-component system osmolarity sensor histidine kinase EnvZ
MAIFTEPGGSNRDWSLPELGRRINRVLPRSLLGRSVMILVTPLILLQVVATWVFYDSFWDKITRRLTGAVAGDVAAIVELMEGLPPDSEFGPLFDMAARTMEIEFEWHPGAILPTDTVVRRETLVDVKLADALAGRVRRPFAIDSRSIEKFVEIHVQLADGVVVATVPRLRLFSSTTYVFILWMVGTSVGLFAVAILFMRKQVRPIRQLAAAADAFGKGRPVEDYVPKGAAEVHLAGAAFLRMRDRIRRQMVQRTEMLAGVSHDLRTPLTRMRLELAMSPETEITRDLKADIDEMQKMLDGYLAFARGEGQEQPQQVDLGPLLRDAIGNAERAGATIVSTIPDGLVTWVRPDAFRRCISNLLTNARRHAGRIEVTSRRFKERIEIAIDDDGPGVPPEHRESVFRPFFRLESSRNQETGGVGLGLTIARDVMRSHGGDLTLDRSPLGGLRALVRLPI